MGARVNYNIKQSDGLYTILYSHWGADDGASPIAKALKAAASRWTDEAYCTRIIINQIIASEWQSVEGFGVHAATSPNLDDAWWIIDLKEQTVTGNGMSLNWLFLYDLVQPQPTK